MPMGKLDFLFGYALAFGADGRRCSRRSRWGSASGCSAWTSPGRSGCSTLVAVADAVLGTALGLFVSAFAQTEFQAVQFMPAVVVPQMLLCGLLVPRDQLPPVLEAISNVLPLSYAVDAMQTLVRTTDTAEVWRNLRHRGRLRAWPAWPSARRRCDGVRRSLRPWPCSVSPCCCSPAARRSRNWSPRCRSRPGSCAATSPARPPRTPSRRRPPWWTDGLSVTLDHLGEDILDAEQAEADGGGVPRAARGPRRAAAWPGGPRSR